MAGLYVHIPFCHSKCIYCDFFSTPDRRNVGAVVDGIISEYEARLGEISSARWETVYFGGGTPSILDEEQLAKLCRALDFSRTVEATIEVNPEDVNTHSAAFWRRCGFNRVSMGLQSFDDGQLRRIGRRHSAADALRAFSVLREAGFDNISCDLIYGLPGQDLPSWLDSLGRLISLRPEHLSAYCLSYEHGTALTRLADKGRITPASDSLIEQMYDALCAATAKAGYEHYEISNFALPDRRSRHNSSYWRSVPYLGLGPGAHSFDGRTRRYNPSDISAWLASCPSYIVDEENDDERYNDLLITALRTADGLDIDALPDCRRDALLRDAAPHLASGHIVLTSGRRLVITEPSWLRADAILRDLIVV